MGSTRILNEPIAVVGSGCRFPGSVDSPSKLWELLKQPRDVQTKIPKERFGIDNFYHPDNQFPGRTNARYAYLLAEDVRAFDAPFFNIQALEAESMDPQQRLLLETVYEAVSNAGMRVQDLQGSSTSVYVGVMTHDYEAITTRDLHESPTYSATGNAASIASNRLSYFFDWHGPSMTIDTACSSSLVAVNLAVEQLRSHQSSMAVVAGSNMILHPLNSVTESNMNMLSPTGRSRMWDANADGYARGEGVCSIVLKTLRQALKDGDSIECIIREVCVNSDGRTTGITMPDHKSQEALIRATYARAGLDTRKFEDRPQFFEAHGTGTPAGDPQEAQAIAKAFFGSNTNNDQGDYLGQHPLYVGSIKTIIGHTEGTAGIAGVLKASLAVQHGIIPPNLWFEKLNSRIAPFYEHLKIPTETATPWPILQPGQPRRVSVNSFGFGGTNAHAIIEEYLPSKTLSTAVAAIEGNILPLVISAKSQRSLSKRIKDMIRFIGAHPDVGMQDLAWTLLQKQSIMPIRRAISGQDRDTVLNGLTDALRDECSTTELRTRCNILGIFTGQGAQWPSMGKSLLTSMPFVRNVVADLDSALQTLPPKHRPSWTLAEQLLSEGKKSNVQHAEFSQPLCCAIQIILLRLLNAAGIQLSVLVGHSSGEIACAFAAGFISASQAIRIAYLRGKISKSLSSSSNGRRGAMLAAGMSYQEAQELCSTDPFMKGICVAASNSPHSATFSGDVDSIERLKCFLDGKSVFSRLLKVDMAYHSHHMLSCSTPYIQALEECGCGIADGNSGSEVIWYSSVDSTSKRMGYQDITAEYWRDNLISPVLFSQAVQRAVALDGSLTMVIEVSCHPALKGPCLATIHNVVAGVEFPYTGCLERGKDDLQAFSGALGYLWERFGESSWKSDMFIEKLFQQRPLKSVAKLLPNYPWDHSTSRRYWTRSRASRRYLHGEVPHLLLGRLSDHSTTSTSQWTNFIRPRDIKWLEGHAIQHQIVFPAAGYVIMAMEAALQVAGSCNSQVALLELVDMSIGKAVVFGDENSQVELNLTAHIVHDPGKTGLITLNFTIHSCLAQENDLSTSVTGQMVITLSSADTPEPILPPPEVEHPGMTSVDVDAFYKELGLLGYNYSKEFRGIRSMKRADSRAIGTIKFLSLKDEIRDQLLVLHPAPLDTVFHAVIGAYSSPGDKRLRTLYVPTHIGRMTLAPSLCLSAVENGTDELNFNTDLTYDLGDSIRADITAFESQQKTLFQVENLTFKPLASLSATTDHNIFTKWCWGPLMPDKILDDPQHWATKQDEEVIRIAERTAHFYIRTFLSDFATEDHSNVIHKKQITWFERVVRESNRSPWYHPSWEADTELEIQNICVDHMYHPQLRLVQRVGENLMVIMRENKNPFDILQADDNLLTEYYTSKLSIGPILLYAQKLVSQIAHRYPTMDILEIGSGTGAVTRNVLAIPQLGFNSYTFTDISTGFFKAARQEFAAFEDRMEFEPLDIGKNPLDQGFEKHSYDLIIAYNVLHATPKLEETMAHARLLLKPGGHMVIVEMTNSDQFRSGFIFGFFADWWAGEDDGRVHEPFVSLERWDDILKRTGFSGIDSRTLDRDAHLFPTSVFSTHAVDATIDALYTPLSFACNQNYPPLVVVGAGSAKTEGILAQMTTTMANRSIQSIASWSDLNDNAVLKSRSTFVVLSELQDQLLCCLSETKFSAVKKLFSNAAHVVWVTARAWVDHPHQASTIGMLRTIAREHTDIKVTLLDVDSADDLDVTFLMEQVLRIERTNHHTLGTSYTWTDEPEIYWCNGRAWIPRLKPDQLRNDRINSARRIIFDHFDSSKIPVALRRRSSEHQYHLESAQDHGPIERDSISPKISKVRVRYSLSETIRLGNLGYFHLVQGFLLEDSVTTSVVALSQTNASIVSVPRSMVFVLPDGLPADGRDILLQIAAAIISDTVLGIVTTLGFSSSILVLDPQNFYIDTLRAVCLKNGVRIQFASRVAGKSDMLAPYETEAPWIELQRLGTESRIKRALPVGIGAFFDMSRRQTRDNTHRCLKNVLPSRCLSYDRDHFIQTPSTSSEPDTAVYLQSMSIPWDRYMKLADISLKQHSVNVFTEIETIPFEDFAVNTDPSDCSTAIIDWKAKSSITARQRPIDSGRLFTKDKTYLLIGLTGDLGRSLSRWMVLHGACSIVLASRNPEVDPKWIDYIGSLGGKITVLSMDVSDEQSVDTGLGTLRTKRLPPVGGIAFAPLVLQDVLFKNMDFEAMIKVLKPKVQGASNLHGRFSSLEEDKALDFFVMFSSVATLLGNSGQGAYTAANCYIQALAQKRCISGLAGSTIDISALFGLGYVSRSKLEASFDAVRCEIDPIGEQELHTLFAEAIVSGRQALQGEQRLKTVMDMADIHVITGVPALDPALKDRITYFDDPRIGHLKIPQRRRKDLDATITCKGSVRDRLLQSKTLKQVQEIIIDGVSGALRVSLRMADGESLNPDIPLVDQGIDSLGVVSVGNWFSKHLCIDLPILKVLGGASLSSLAADGASQLDSHMVPLIQRERSVGESEPSIRQSDESESTPPTDIDSIDWINQRKRKGLFTDTSSKRVRAEEI